MSSSLQQRISTWKACWNRTAAFHLKKHEVEFIFLLSGGFMENTGRSQEDDLTLLNGHLLDLNCVWRLQDMESSLQVLKLLFCFWNWTESWQQRQEHECYSLRLSNSRWQGRQTASVTAAFSLLWTWSTFKAQKEIAFQYSINFIL